MCPERQPLPICVQIQRYALPLPMRCLLWGRHFYVISTRFTMDRMAQIWASLLSSNALSCELLIAHRECLLRMPFFSWYIPHRKSHGSSTTLGHFCGGCSNREGTSYYPCRRQRDGYHRLEDIDGRDSCQTDERRLREGYVVAVETALYRTLYLHKPPQPGNRM